MKRLRNILPLLVILGGMLILFYPTISNFLIMRNASRASLTLTLVGHGGTVQVSAIGAGGGTGAFTHFDWGTGDAFVQLVKKILSKGPFEGM